MPAGPPRCCAADKSGLLSGGGIGRKIRFLSRPDSYPEQPSRVAAIETHFSWVFLTDTHAYKLKKPVRGNGFDFRSIEGRRRNALVELRLNRRLAADVYSGMVAVTLEADGKLAIGGPGEPVDWLVKMVRLNADDMFDRRLARGDWHAGEIEALAHRLAGFFATAPRARLSARQWTAQIAAELHETMALLSRAGEPRLVALAQPIVRRLGAFLVRRAGLFRRRIKDRRLVDGHGDLRPEHVYLKGTPRVIDCLEFRADLRQLDPVNELAFLALECRRLGGPHFERQLLRRYRERTGDTPPPLLLRFYAALNAIVRARIAVEHLAEPGARKPEEWVNRAVAYLAMAAKESRRLLRR